MKAVEKLESLLEDQSVCYELFKHPIAYTSQMTAQAEHVPGSEEAKVVILNADGKNVMVVLPSTHHVDLSEMADLLGALNVRLETESNLDRLFPDCETGAMPPFGNIYQMPVYVDRALTENENIVFNAGSHFQAMRMKYEDYSKLVRPKVRDIALRIDQ